MPEYMLTPEKMAEITEKLLTSQLAYSWQDSDLNAWIAKAQQQADVDWLEAPCTEHPLDMFFVFQHGLLPRVFHIGEDDKMYFDRRKDCPVCYQQWKEGK